MWNRRIPPQWIQESDWSAEGATRTFEAGDLGQALRLADRSVTLTRKIHKRDGLNGIWSQRLAERLRTRAEIHQADGAYRAAIADCTEAISVWEASALTKYPLFVPDVHLILAEVYASLGEREPAVRHGEAIERYRALEATDDSDAIMVARALARYAKAMATVGERERGDTAAREYVAIMRPRIADTYRIDDLAAFAQAVYQLAEPTGQSVPDPESAVEMVPLLRDAIEQMARTVSQSPVAYADPKQRDYALSVLYLLERQGVWLAALGAPRLAAIFEYQSRHLIDQPVRDWTAILTQLRTHVDEALRLRTDPPTLP
jgi:tetratricopeptide (TPR) repeat protein